MKKMLFFLFIAIFISQAGPPAAGAADGLYLGLKTGAALEQGKGEQKINAGSGQFQEYNNAPEFDLSNNPFNLYTGHDTKAALLLGAQIGYDFHRVFSIPLRIELDYTYRTPSELEMARQATLPLTVSYQGNSMLQLEPVDNIHRSKITMQTLMTNFVFDFHNSSSFTPYVGAGAGLAFLRLKTHDTFIGNAPNPKIARVEVFGDESDTNFAWSLSAGLGYALTENLTLDLGYRFLHAGDVFSNQAINLNRPPYPEVNYSLSGKSGLKNLNTHDITVGARYGF